MCVCLCLSLHLHVCVLCADLYVCVSETVLPYLFIYLFKGGTVEQNEKKAGRASDGDPTNAADQRDTAHSAEQEQPPSKKTALENLLGATFVEPAITQYKSRI